MFFFTGSWEYIGTEWCFFDLSTGTIGNKSGEVSGSFNLVGSNGFRRIGYTVTSPALTVNVMQSIDAAEGDNDYYFMGDGSTKDVYLWGAKVEAASSATQYGTAYYGTSVTTEPQGVWQSNVSLVKCSTKSQLFPGSFWFDSVNSRVYVKATDLTSPSGYAMELGARDYAVYVSSINYVTIKNMVERAE
jgi:hypothetical protein